MKQLVIAAAISLALATIPAVASTTFTISSSSPNDGYSWISTCPTDFINVQQAIKAKGKGDDVEIFINVQREQNVKDTGVPPPNPPKPVKIGGDGIELSCNGALVHVNAGSSFLCKTRGNVSWYDYISDNKDLDGAVGTFTIEY